MNKPSSSHQFKPSGFFVLRTPLLPWDEVEAWSAALEAPTAAPEELSVALQADRTLLRTRLRSLLDRPSIREALFLASPELESQLDLWRSTPDSERGRKVEHALIRYFMRMAGRPTPFGLFAGCSTGLLGPVTRVTLGDATTYRRHTRLDMDYVFALTQALGKDTALHSALIYRPNSSLYRAAGRLRYAEARMVGRHRSYHLVAVEPTEYLLATLERAANGAHLRALAEALVADDSEIALEEAEAYIAELVESQILLPELDPAVTGPEPIHSLVHDLGRVPASSRVVERLATTRDALAAVDAKGIGVPTDQYRSLAAELEPLSVPVDLPRLFQVDLFKPAPGLTLGPSVLAEISRGIDLLHRLGELPASNSLDRFREEFQLRYEGREVPLVEALDEESGIGFGTNGEESAPLLRGLPFLSREQSNASWGSRESLLLRKLYDAQETGASEITLTSEDVAQLENPSPRPLPPGFAVMAKVAAASAEQIDRGAFRLALDLAAGPSGARLLGRFVHGDETMLNYVQEHLRAEEAQEPDAIFAEIAHLPQGRLGNILMRPVLRTYEIAYLGRSGAPLAQQLPITDLMVSMQNGEVILRSRKLGRRVIPRLTNAHNYSGSGNLGLYRFLCALQGQGVADVLKWHWGALAGAPYLPRVVSGRLILSPSTWNIDRHELQALKLEDEAARFQAVQAWRAKRRLPRFVLLADGDNTLPVDLDNTLSVEGLLHLLRQRTSAVLVEMFPAPDELCANGPEGAFTHEVIVPFVRTTDSGQAPGDLTQVSEAPAAEHQATNEPAMFVRRTFPPGSEWFYARIYTGTATADQLLQTVVRPLTRAVLASGAADSWFFIRYGDPQWHLRLRFHGDPGAMHAILLSKLEQVSAHLLDEGQIWRVELGTYEREIERYGGQDGIGLAERLFHADSEAVLDLLDAFPGDAGTEARWRVALTGIDRLLDDLGLDLSSKHRVMKQMRRSFGIEFRVSGPFTGLLGNKFRAERNELEQALDPGALARGSLAQALPILNRRSTAIRPIAMELQALSQAGRLSHSIESLTTSYIHMHVNRLLRSTHRAQELVLYDFLSRLYGSMVARQEGR